MVSRTVDSIRWVRREDGVWEEESGRYTIELVDDFEYECDNPHPVRLSRKAIDEYHSAFHSVKVKYPFEIRSAIREGRKGYMCPGGEIHLYSLWVGGDKGGTDVFTRDEYLKDAMLHMAAYIKEGKNYA